MFRSFFFSILFLFPVYLNSQTPSNILGDPSEIKEVIISGNEITSVVFNYGSIGKPNYLGNIADLVWKELGYMFEFGPLIAAKVVNDNGDTLRIVSDSFILPSQGSYNPSGTLKWGWLPRPGYSNPNNPKVAISSAPDTWHPDWTAWPGEFGDGVIIGQEEVYYVIDDFTNAKFPYYPFPDNHSKRGTGVSAEVRIYQFGGNLKDALILRYKLTNESPKPLNEVYFGFHGDPHIGGPGDWADDRVKLIGNNGPAGFPNHLWSKNTIYLWDNNMTGDGGRWCGYLAFKFLETPDNLDLTSFNVAHYTNSLPNVPKNNSLMWQWLSGGIDTTSDLYNQPGDNIINFGTGSFQLMSGESKYITLAIFFGEDYRHIVNSASQIYFSYNWPEISNSIGSSGGNNSYTVSLTSPNPVNEGNIPITWNFTGTNPDAKIYIEYSSDRGRKWYFLTSEHPINEPFLWNTTEIKDGVNYLLRIVAYNPENKRDYYYSVSEQKFTINNPGNAQPELELLFDFENSVIHDAPLNIKFLAEDADNSELNVVIEYSHNPTENFMSIYSGIHQTGTINYNWDFSSLPNAYSYYIRVKISDGELDSVLTSKWFSINQYQGYYSDAIFEQISGRATPDLHLQVSDPNLLQNNNYELTFNIIDENNKTLSIKNLNSGNTLITDYPVISTVSTPAFEGLKLFVADRAPDINFNKTYFSNKELEGTYTITIPPIGNPIKKIGEDWIIIFNDLDTNADGTYKYPGDTAMNQLNRAVVCPFRIIHIGTMQKATYRIYELYQPLRDNGKWDFIEPIILQPQGTTSPATAYSVKFNFENITPVNDDTLYIITYKSITDEDVFRFRADTSYLVGVEPSHIPADYELYQNYPNPFNPNTIISYNLPQSSLVTLKIYDILGREIVQLVNEVQQTGKYEVNFNAGGLSSGIYIYQLKAVDISSQKKNHFIQSKKMMLLR